MIFSRPRNAPENEPDALAASTTSDLNRVGARSALVIDTGTRVVAEKKSLWKVNEARKPSTAKPIVSHRL